ncbi:nucleoside-diphosphate kinase [Anaerosinus massiliensis]|uniref:nucleoside-diphosphate kinase n=1 Tax=Massilibacillus massiliensis TaxID=1806837 RepID=UPI000AB98A2D|nr:nucleoside-diphosphate kinase [Massilibacillus massiliensis]
MESTLVLIKPDAFSKHYTGEIIKRYEASELTITALKLLKMTPELAAKHYAEHVEKPFYPSLVEFMTSGPIVAMVLSGENAIGKVRKLNGATNPEKAEPGTIRADFAESMSCNAVHASDSKESAEREIHIFFNEAEIFA